MSLSESYLRSLYLIWVFFTESWRGGEISLSELYLEDLFKTPCLGGEISLSESSLLDSWAVFWCLWEISVSESCLLSLFGVLWRGGETSLSESCLLLFLITFPVCDAEVSLSESCLVFELCLFAQVPPLSELECLQGESWLDLPFLSSEMVAEWGGEVPRWERKNLVKQEH